MRELGDLETRAGEQLLFITGSLDIGPKGSAVIEGSLRSCREHALARLAAAVGEARDGNASAVVVRGDSGMGKSALLSC